MAFPRFIGGLGLDDLPECCERLTPFGVAATGTQDQVAELTFLLRQCCRSLRCRSDAPARHPAGRVTEVTRPTRGWPGLVVGGT